MIEQGTDDGACNVAGSPRRHDSPMSWRPSKPANQRIAATTARSLCEAADRQACPKRTATAPMLVGTEREPDARALYQVRTRRLVDEKGLSVSKAIMPLAHRRRLIGDDGLLEIKCPNPATHIDYLRLPVGECPKAYYSRYRGRCLPLAGHGAISCRIARFPASCRRHSPRYATSKRGKTGNGAGSSSKKLTPKTELRAMMTKGSSTNLARLAFTGSKMTARVAMPRNRRT